MSLKTLHPDETPLSLLQIHTLLSSQFPQYATLPLQPLQDQGSDNLMIRLGDTLVIRLPRTSSSEAALLKELHYLPILQQHALSLDIPTPITQGLPSTDYPFSWAIYPWLSGTSLYQFLQSHQTLNMSATTTALVDFLQKIRTIDASYGSESSRSQPLQNVALELENEHFPLLDPTLFDSSILYAFWKEALSAPRWLGPPVWTHGDLHAGNLLVQNNTLSAIIDFGGLGAGDPAVDFIVAWTVLDKPHREIFRKSTLVDDPTWLRARGWAIYFGVCAYTYYVERNPVLAHIAKNTLLAVIEG